MNARAIPMVAVSLLLLTLILWTGSLAVSEPLQPGAFAPVPVALQTTPTTAPTATGPLDDRLLHDRSLITGDPCAAPCWRGITPGVTAWEDALAILEDAPSIASPSVQTTDGSPVANAYFHEPGGPSDSGWMMTNFGQTADMISLRFAPGITLGEVIARYGDPDYALGTVISDDPPQAQVTLAYPDDQMFVYVFVPGQTGMLDDSSEVMGVLYMTAQYTSLFVGTTSLHTWEGMAPFSTYGLDAPFDVTPGPFPGPSATPTVTDVPVSLLNDRLLHDRSLITGDPCAAPCWRGITPGTTSWDLALSILEDDPNILDPTIQTAEDSASVAASFREPGGIDASGQIYSEDGQRVGLVFLRLAPTMTLGEVLSVYGEPTYAIGSPFSDNPPQATVNLVYPDDQIIVYVFVAGTAGKLEDTGEVVGVLYMQPADMETLLETSSLHAWEGLAPFATYSEDAPFELTPIPTAGD